MLLVYKMGLSVICLPSAHLTIIILCPSLSSYTIGQPCQRPQRDPSRPRLLLFDGLWGLSLHVLAFLTLRSPLQCHFLREALSTLTPVHTCPVLCFFTALPERYFTAFGYVLLCFLLLSPEGELRVGIVCVLLFTQPLIQWTVNT